MNYSELKSVLKTIWNFIWNDDSIWSWLVNIVLAFVIIKFIVYPGLGFLLSTDYPIVAVVSSSMEHDGNFDNWWSPQESWYLGYDITKEQFLDDHNKLSPDRLQATFALLACAQVRAPGCGRL